MGVLSARVRLSRIGTDSVSVAVTDEYDTPVLSIDSLVLRPVLVEQLPDAGDSPDSLHTLEWVEVPGVERVDLQAGGGADEWLILGREGGELATSLPMVKALQDVDALRASIEEGRPAPGVVLADYVQIPDPASEDVVGEVQERVVGALDLLQAWLADELLVGSRLVIVTRGAVSAGVDGAASDLAGGAVGGLVRSAQSESPGSLVLVDVGVDGLGELPELLNGVLGCGEQQVVVRDGVVLAPRLARADLLSPRDASTGGVGRALPALAGSGGTVLVTGGTGGLGGLVAEHLVSKHGVTRLLLTSRRGLAAEGAQGLLERLSGLGAEVEIVACNVADRAQVQALLDGIDGDHPLSAVVHTAGILDDGVLGSLTHERVMGVLAPKVGGAWNLHELTRDLDLSAFILFSSVAGLLGSLGQASYAAANAFLDALAAQRRAHGLPGVSLAWGPWAQVGGMADRLGEVDNARIGGLGLVSLPAEEGLELFDRAYDSGEALLAPVKLDKRALRRRAVNGTLPALLQGLIRTVRRVPDRAARLAPRLSAAPEGQRHDIALEFVRAEVAMVLGHPSPAAVDVKVAFKDLGFQLVGCCRIA